MVQLAMIQAGDGNWYAYFVAKDQASNAVVEDRLWYNSTDADDFTTTTDDIVYTGATEC